MTGLFQRLRLIWLVLIGLPLAATGSFGSVSGDDGVNGWCLAAKKPLSSLDSTGKVHGELPKANEK
jgi:hypothetical protein